MSCNGLSRLVFWCYYRSILRAFERMKSLLNGYMYDGFILVFFENYHQSSSFASFPLIIWQNFFSSTIFFSMLKITLNRGSRFLYTVEKAVGLNQWFSTFSEPWPILCFLKVCMAHCSVPLRLEKKVSTFESVLFAQ